MCEENTKLQGVVEHADNELSLHELEIVWPALSAKQRVVIQRPNILGL